MPYMHLQPACAGGFFAGRLGTFGAIFRAADHVVTLTLLGAK
jgi:hypothetical protein